MSFINWGEDTPDRRADRRRFEEEQMLYEQAIRIKQSSQSPKVATPVVGANGLLLENNYVINYVDDYFEK